MRKRAQRIVTMTVITLLCALVSFSGASAMSGSAFFCVPVATTAVTASLINYNVGALRSDEPSRFGGLCGALAGGMTATYGVVVLSSDNNRMIPAGAVITAIGVTSIYYGVKNLIRVRTGYLEGTERGLSIDPVLVGLDRETSDIGVQISYRF
jgi:hypothetical protein